MVMTSANHDEHHFAAADLLNIRRENAGDHLSFGYGAHQCLGKNLARMELQVFLDELSRRLPHMRLAPQSFTYLNNLSFRGPEHLWVEWDPAQNPERRDLSVLQRSHPVRIGESTRPDSVRSLRVERLRHVAREVIELTLVSADGRPLPPWQPGAHIEIACGDSGIARQYSLCGDPADTQTLRVAVLREPHSRGGSAWVHERLSEGDLLSVRGPRNHFRFDEGAKRVLLIAGGIGITPIATMAVRARQLGIDYQIHYCGRARNTMAYADELQAQHGERLAIHASDEKRRLDVGALLSDLPDGMQVYACGPERLLSAVQSACASRPHGTLHVEHFRGGAGRPDPAHDSAFDCELNDSGLSLHVPADRTLLEVLRDANIDVPSDCGEGLCGSCEVEVIGGEVDHRDVVLTADERQENRRMMACCSRGRGRIVLGL